MYPQNARFARVVALGLVSTGEEAVFYLLLKRENNFLFDIINKENKK